MICISTPYPYTLTLSFHYAHRGSPLSNPSKYSVAIPFQHRRSSSRQESIIHQMHSIGLKSLNYPSPSFSIASKPKCSRLLYGRTHLTIKKLCVNLEVTYTRSLSSGHGSSESLQSSRFIVFQK
ncbi:unnamed protein product [Cuscuta epithymum]|uniref:Uncharacterized protein n=1 Tax=Cuscuta epithymum TaxID=186058 RepID=A0AAV0CZM7_9ASTE|nr:unnamed protein product [Cuscuta epithymum]CAH9085927.1 unnamed protein product [Cuscuta epithymum]CAH9133103.1 unnamed protein product [Cuscuta epithymum]